MKTDPSVIARTPKTVITVAAWVRFTIVEQKSPNVPRPRAVAISTMYPRTTSSGATPPKTNTTAVTGTDAAMRMNT